MIKTTRAKPWPVEAATENINKWLGFLELQYADYHISCLRQRKALEWTNGNNRNGHWNAARSSDSDSHWLPLFFFSLSASFLWTRGYCVYTINMISDVSVMQLSYLNVVLLLQSFCTQIKYCIIIKHSNIFSLHQTKF